MFVSQGSLVTKSPLDLTSAANWFPPQMAPMSSGGWPSAYAAMYRRHLWVYTLVSKRARATARLPLPVYQHDELNRPKVDNHPMASLLARPNPAMTGFNLWKWTSSTYDIHGITFWLKRRPRGGGAPIGLFPLHPSAMIYDDASGRWSFDNGKVRLADIDDADLVIFRDFDPDSLNHGMSPLEPLRSTLENEWNARTATASFWARGARPGFVLSHPGRLTPKAADRLRTEFDSIKAGAGNTGSTLVLEEAMEAKPLTLTAEEAQYIETRKLNREEVCAAFDVPPPVVHILDHATFSNITEQMRSMYRDTMAPHLKGFEAAIELDLRQAEWPDDDVYAEFLMDEVLRGDFETRQDALNKATHMTLAEKRKMENLPFIEGTDRIFLNTATMPLDAIDAQAAALGASAWPSSLPASDVRSVMGRLSWQESLDDVRFRDISSGLDPVHANLIHRALEDESAAAGSVAGLRERIRALAKE